jgi:hypothetical protein
MSTDETMDTLLGAYALDALDDDERAAIEAYLRRSTEAQAEVRRLDIAVDALAEATSPPPLPAGSWARVRAAMRAQPVDSELAEPSPLPPLTLPADRVIPIERAGQRRRARVVTAVLAAAAALIVGVGVGRVAMHDGTRRGEVALEQLAGEALRDPDARVGTLEGTGLPGVRAVVDPRGHGYLFAGDLPSLPPGRTYQLWDVDGTVPISLAVLGPDPGIVTFTAGDPARRLALTDEAVPGAAAPLGTPLVSGALG